MSKLVNEEMSKWGTNTNSFAKLPTAHCQPPTANCQLPTDFLLQKNNRL